MKITLDELYEMILERILKEEGRLRETPYVLAYKVLLDRYTKEEVDKMMKTYEMDDMLFDLVDMMRTKAKENGYTMRLVPCSDDGGRWGLPYNLEYYFSKKTK